MCAWADEKEHVDIVKGEEIELLRISYGMDHVEANARGIYRKQRIYVQFIGKV